MQKNQHLLVFLFKTNRSAFMNQISHIIDSGLQLKEFESFDEFEAHVLTENKAESLKTALALSLRVTSIGQAFALGYRCALQCLLPSLKQDTWAALCVTERTGSSPKQLKTKVDKQGYITGEKSFVSMADKAEQLIVIAITGEPLARPNVKAVLISNKMAGVAIDTIPNMGMMPELEHGTLSLTNVKGNILEGDGYGEINKPFRGIEDAHLLMAFTGLVLSKTVRYELSDTLLDDCLLIIHSLLSVEFNDSPWSTLQINAAYRLFSKVLETFEEGLSSLPESFDGQWHRDKKVFSLAVKTRALKREKAVERIFPSH